MVWEPGGLGVAEVYKENTPRLFLDFGAGDAKGAMSALRQAEHHGIMGQSF